MLTKSIHKIKKTLEEYSTLWIPAKRYGDTAVGYTFEELLGKSEDNRSDPDLPELEIKAFRSNSNSAITLFTKSPDYPKSANSFIREEYGVNGQIHASIFGNKIIQYKDYFWFGLVPNDETQKLILEIYDPTLQRVENELEIYWEYQTLHNILCKKLKNLCLVQANSKKENGTEYFMYNQNFVVLSNPLVENFISLIKSGDIQFDIRIGTYKTGKNAGKTHDHGSGFRIMWKNLYKLYSKQENF